MEHTNFENAMAETEDKNIFAVGTAQQETPETAEENVVTEASGADLAVVESQEAGVYVHKFKVPFVWMGNSYSELKFNFGKLLGVDAMAVYAELRTKGIPVINSQRTTWRTWNRVEGR